jgi:hypothetical protein
MKRSDFIMDSNELAEKIFEGLKKEGRAYVITQSDVDKINKEGEELKKYKWLYKVVCLALHDTTEIPLEEIKKDFEHLWDLKSAREENKKNVN